jgi:hypothetical protein
MPNFRGRLSRVLMHAASGYGCYDHFLEGDTTMHSWEVLAKILSSEETGGIVCDVGMCVVFPTLSSNRNSNGT